MRSWLSLDALSSRKGINDLSLFYGLLLSHLVQNTLVTVSGGLIRSEVHRVRSGRFGIRLVVVHVLGLRGAHLAAMDVLDFGSGDLSFHVGEYTCSFCSFKL